MRAEVDDYVDTKLANFEVVLDKTLTAVRRGRDKLSGRTAHGDLAAPEGFEDLRPDSLGAGDAGPSADEPAR